jgi:hypothetical protein
VSAEQPVQITPLESKSPFELRVNQGISVSESAVKRAQPSMVRVCGWWRGLLVASFAAFTAITLTRGT